MSAYFTLIFKALLGQEQRCVCVCVCLHALTRYPSKVNGLLGPSRAALFGADAVLAGCVHVELQDVVLLHHWRREQKT